MINNETNIDLLMNNNTKLILICINSEYLQELSSLLHFYTLVIPFFSIKNIKRYKVFYLKLTLIIYFDFNTL